MDMKKKILIIMINIITYISLTKEEVCETFRCGTLPDPQCSSRQVENITLATSFTLQSCKSSSQQCPFYNYDSQDTLNCEDKRPELIKLYPGGPCTKDSDCFSNSCKNDTCAGTPNDEVCEDHRECYYGSACLINDTSSVTKYCLPQRKEKENCHKDEDCVNTHGCYNNTCVKYFSLPDGHPLTRSYPQLPSLCESGFDYNFTCARWRQADPNAECTDTNTCHYINFDGTNVSVPENCLCGFNRSGKKYCKLGNAHDNYVAYVNKMKKVLEDVSHCNTEERGVCNHDRRIPTQEFSFQSQNLTNAKIKAENYHDLVDADICVINVAFPEFVPEKPSPPSPSPPGPTPESGYCAKYTCKKKQDVCAHSHYENSQISVVLSDICQSTEYCDVKGDPNVVFYNKVDVNGNCSLIKPNTEGSLRYPGEGCRSNEDCFAPDKTKYPNESIVGTCLGGICRGYNETQSCSETSWCWKGLYCGNEGKCIKQRSEKENCTRTSDCKNNYLCYKGTCQNVWFSLSVGEDASSQDYPAEYYCTFGRASKNGRCDYLNSTDEVDSKSNLVKCTHGQMCNYTSLDGPVQQACQCGYNEEGYSYCPKGNAQDTNKWEKLASSRAAATKNTCHSESRAMCYEIKEDYLTDIKDYEHVTETAHLFYGAPSCVIRVLDSSFLQSSYLILIISFLAMILA